MVKDQLRANSEKREETQQTPFAVPPFFFKGVLSPFSNRTAGLCDTSGQVIPLSLHRRLFQARYFGEESSVSRHVCQNIRLSGFHEVLRDRERKRGVGEVGI